MKKKASVVSVCEMVMAGLNDSIAYSKAKKSSLVTTRIPVSSHPKGAKKA